MSLKKTIKKALPQRAFDAIEPTGHKLETILASYRQGNPAKKLRVIGVTGTNGKTSTAFMLFSMLKEAGYKVGIMTTVAYGVGDNITPQQAHMTTVSGPKLQKQLRSMLDDGAEWLILETTSHALAQYRVWGIPFEIAVLTNVTHEHLDYHKTFERYTEAKRQLFAITARNPKGFGVVNADDPQASLFTETLPSCITYGLSHGDLQPEDVQLSSKKSLYHVTHNGTTYTIVCNIPGEFNVANSLACIGVGVHLGLTKAQIEQGIAALTSVAGRMNSIDEGQPYAALIDFAHTPDSFERLLSDVRKQTKGKLVVLFGSAGRRDVSKRAQQGAIAATYADALILTEEDDRDEDGMEIISSIRQGALKQGFDDDAIYAVLDRKQAISTAVGLVEKAGDTVVFLGKGHEATIERANESLPWNEEATVRAAIRQQLG